MTNQRPEVRGQLSVKAEGRALKSAVGGRNTEVHGKTVTHLDTLPQGVLLYTKPQMAAALQVSLRCLTGMMNRGEISYLKIHGHLVRFRPEDALRRLNETALVCKDTHHGKAEVRMQNAE